MKLNSTKNNSKIQLLAILLALPILLLSGCGSQSEDSTAMEHMSRAETYSEQGQFRSAILEVRNAIQTEPNNPDHVIGLADLYLTIGANDQAIELLKPWMSDFPDKASLPLARAYANRGKQLSALETLDNFNADSPEEALEAGLIKAEAHRLRGELPEALDLYQTLLTENPASLEAITGLAKVHLGRKQTAAATDAIDSWVQTNEKRAEPLYLKGLALYQANQLEKASETLTEAVGLLPNSDIFLPLRRDILTTLSRVLTEQGNMTEAQIYNRVLAENTNSEITEQGQSALTAIRDGDLEQAKSILRDMLSLNPENQRAAMMLGAVFAETGDLDEGVRLLTENLDPETTPTQFIRAATMASIDAGQREEALKTLDRAIVARPGDNELLAMHGILALSLPDHEDIGIASLSKAIAREPDRVRLRLALANHYIQNSQPEQALGQLRMAFTSNPTDWIATRAYLTLLLDQDETKEAEEVRDSLLNGYPEEPYAILLASITDVNLGNRQVAKARLEKLTSENPQLQPAQIALATLYAREGQIDQAVNTMVEAARLNPDSIQPLQRAGQIYASQHSVEEVEIWLEETGNKYPQLAMNADILAALINIRRGDLAEARIQLDDWQEADSQIVRRATAQLLRAETIDAANSERFDAARAKAAEAISLEPENLSFALLPMSLYQLEGKTDKALSALAAVEQTFGKQPQVILSRATLIGHKEGSQSAHRYLLIEWENTGNPRLLPLLIRLSKTEAPETLGDLTDTWIQSAPDNVAAHMARADWLMANNQEIVAADHYEQVLEQQGNNIAALNNLAWLLRSEDQKRALELADQAQSLAPNNPAVLDTYGWILHLSGRHVEAQEIIEKALALAPDNLEIQGHLEAIESAL